MRCRSCRPLPEEVARAADLLGRRWTLAILWASAEAGAVRFNEFKQTLEGIPPRTLAARLAELEEAGVLHRTAYQTAPPRYDYHLTESGRALVPVLDALLAWGVDHAVSPRDPDRQRVYRPMSQQKESK